MNTKKITTCALMIALSTVLMWVSKILPAPWLQGGSTTLASMVPIIFTGILFGTKAGLCASFAYALIQMLFGFYPPPTRTLTSFILVIMLDYLRAFGVLGLSGLIFKFSGKRAFSAALAAFSVTVLRYVCHILSGILIWGVYAPKGQGVLLYSLIYNGSYMIPEILISTAVTWFIYRTEIIKSFFPKA